MPMNWLFQEEMEMTKNWNSRRGWWEAGMYSSSLRRKILKANKRKRRDRVVLSYVASMVLLMTY